MLKHSLCLALVCLGAAPAFAQDPTDKPDPHITDGSAQRALDAAQAKWKARGARSYRFQVAVICFCPDTKPHTVTVRGGKPIHPAQMVVEVATIPRLFRQVRGAITKKVATLTVSYDKTYGFPKSVFIDTSKMIADEERTYSAGHYKVLRK